MRNADLVVCTGLDLEIGWLPMLVQQSGNARLAAGSPGYFEAGRFVTPLEVPVRLDRSDGDVHAQGNPHIQLDPRNIAKVAAALAERLARIDAPNAAAYQERLQAFQGRWSASVAKWEQQALPLKGVAVVSHHKNMSYLWAWLGVREVGTLEPKPGVEPSAGHLSALSAQLARQPAKMVVRSAYEDPRAVAVAVGSREGPRGRAAVHGRRQRQGDRPVRTVRQHGRAAAGRCPMSLAAIDLGILAPAFLAGLLVLSTHVPLGAQVLRKGIVFIDLAIAQIAALGVVVAGLFDLASNGWQMQAAAAAAALAGAFLLNWTERKWPQVQEAQIGVVFVLAATAGILLLSKNPHGGEHLRDLLAGQILWVGYPQLVIPLVATVAILALWFGLRSRLSPLGFYLVFALAVTVSVQLVGVYLVFATLDRAEPGSASASAAAAPGARLCDRHPRLCDRPRAVGRARPAIRRADRLVPGAARGGGACDRAGHIGDGRKRRRSPIGKHAAV